MPAAPDARRVMLFSHETTLSGAPIQLAYLHQALPDQGWSPVFAAPAPGPLSDNLARNGADMRFDPDFLIDSSHGHLRELCRSFDVVVANTITAWPVVRAAHAESIPVLWYIHETLVAAKFIAENPVIRSTLDLAQQIVVPTAEAARILQGVTSTPIEVVPYGIPAPETEPRCVASDPTSFVALGSFEARKGQDIFVEAIRLLDADVRSRGRFKMAGRVLDQPFATRLVDRAAGFPEIEIVDALDHAGAVQMLADADVFVCPSRDETMPITLIEAMALGKASINANVGGISEWVRDGMNGLMFARENAAALAAAMTQCLSEPALVRRLGSCAKRTFARHFTLDRFTSSFAASLDKLRSPPIAASDAAELSEYDRWIARFNTPNESRRISLRRQLRSLRRQPLISILLPVYNPEPEFIRAAVESVRNQIYTRWELCIADDASTNPEVRPYLEQLAAADKRVRVILRDENGHISACSNSALSLATGEWCALLDHDDALTEHALATVALEIDRAPEAGLIYSDEDKIDAAGRRSNPFFKPDWNPELFLGQNFINHLGVYRTSLLREIGGFRQGYEGSQDYDLALRCIERLRDDQIRHLPQILYHWRMAAGSLAAVADAKSYAKEAARRAIADHLTRGKIAATTEPCPENAESHRVVFPVPDPLPLVSVIIPMRDRVDLLRTCIRGLRERTSYRNIEIIVIDNGSVEVATRDYLGALGCESDAQVIRDGGTFNFSRVNNRAAQSARGDILAFVNNDIEADRAGWLDEMVSHASRPQVGAVGARLWYPDGTLQHGGVILGLGGVAGHALYRIPRGHAGYFNRSLLQQNSSAVTAACLLVRRSVFEQIGGFDEVNLAINFNDVDLCLRITALGLRIVWSPYTDLIHHESASRGHHMTAEQQSQFVREATYLQQKWGAQLLDDPYYNPNLSLRWPGFGLAFPPRVRARDVSQNRSAVA